MEGFVSHHHKPLQHRTMHEVHKKFLTDSSDTSLQNKQNIVNSNQPQLSYVAIHIKGTHPLKTQLLLPENEVR